MRLRREAGGKSIDDVAAVLGRLPQEQSWAAAEIKALEADAPRNHATLVQHIALLGVFPFDPIIYFALVGAAQKPGSPVPPVCRHCACSWNDPCEHNVDGRTDLCRWSADPSLCTRCVETAIDTIIDHDDSLVFAAEEVPLEGGECPACTGALGPAYGTAFMARACSSCATTFFVAEAANAN